MVEGMAFNDHVLASQSFIGVVFQDYNYELGMD